MKLHTTKIDKLIYGHCNYKYGLFYDKFIFLKKNLPIKYRNVITMPKVPKWENSRKPITNEQLGVVDEHTANKFVA